MRPEYLSPAMRRAERVRLAARGIQLSRVATGVFSGTDHKQIAKAVMCLLGFEPGGSDWDYKLCEDIWRVRVSDGFGVKDDDPTKFVGLTEETVEALQRLMRARHQASSA